MTNLTRWALVALFLASIGLGVPTQASAVGCSVSVATFSELQSAFTTCNTAGGGVITVTANIDTTARLLYTGSGSLTIQSDVIGTLRRIQATGTRSWSVIESSAGQLVIDSLEITGGNATAYGVYGGGVQGYKQIIVRNSYIHDNTGSTGGGLGLGFITSGAWREAIIDNSRVESNTSTVASTAAGGGFYATGGDETVTITNSSFINNKSSQFGAAISFYNTSSISNYTLTNVTIGNNSTSHATTGFGAVAFNQGKLYLNFATFYENKNAAAGKQADIYCGMNGACSVTIVGSIFGNTGGGGTCSINATARDATYSVSNIAPGQSNTCLNNINSAGTTQTALQNTNVTSTVTNMLLSNTPALNSGTTSTYALLSGTSTAASVVPSSVGSLYTSVDQRGLARSGSMWSAGAFEFNATPVLSPSTSTLTFAAGGITYRVNKQLTATSNSINGKMTFLANGKRIGNCISLSVSAANSYTATCNYLPSTRGSVMLVALFTPTDSASYKSSSSVPVYSVINNRITTR